MNNNIMNFIKRRFPTDCDWLTGNCYFFALILQSVFGGEIYYDVTNGHFLLGYEKEFYDWRGKSTDYGTLIKWKDFEKYDSIQKQRIIRDCIK